MWSGTNEASMRTLSSGQAEVIGSSRGDLVAFSVAFGAGWAAYVLLHVVLQLRQPIVTTVIVAVMVVYATLVVRAPRLRVRLDQAGDNAYYLGLLFTLNSMAFALYQFGAATVEPENGPELRSAGVQQIISNFGIALASTIAGIFLRVFLHQMRVDPAEVEGMTRIELAEASKKVRAILESVTLDLGQFHDEVRQRSGDLVTKLAERAQELVGRLEREVERATGEVLGSASTLQETVRGSAEALADSVAHMATELSEAVKRLQAVEPPPLTLVRRLERLSRVLDRAGTQTEEMAASLQESVRAATAVADQMATAAATLEGLGSAMRTSHAETIHRIGLAVDTVTESLNSAGGRLAQESQLLQQLEEQSRRSAEESARAQGAAVEVLTRLTDVARGLTATFRDGGTSGADGRAR